MVITTQIGRSLFNDILGAEFLSYTFKWNGNSLGKPSAYLQPV